MSYGRRPHYIYDNGESIVFDGESIPHSAIAQFLWTLVLRAEGGDTQLEELIQLGGKIREATWERRAREKDIEYKVHVVGNDAIVKVNIKERPNGER